MPDWLAVAWSYAEKAGPLGSLVLGVGWWLHWRADRAVDRQRLAAHAAEIERMTALFADANARLQATHDKLLQRTLDLDRDGGNA